VITLWSIFRSPLIFGGDLPSNDAASTALITNEEVLDVNQHSSGGHEVLERMDFRVWLAYGTAPGEYYVAVFNLSDDGIRRDVTVPWFDIGILGSVTAVRDLWAHKSVEETGSLKMSLRPHASALYRVMVSNGSGASRLPGTNGR